MNLIFLDFDGVIVTRKTRYLAGDEQCIAALNRLTDATCAGLVVSSCWRVGREVIDLRELLKGWGVKARVVDRTPHLGWNATRGEEISAWLESYSRDVAGFVILDDDDDMGSLSSRLIRTRFDIGLTEADADKGIAALCSTPST